MSKASCELASNGFFSLHSICLSRARTSEPAAVRNQVFDKKVESWSKARRKPARTCRKAGCKPGRKPGLQLARIMECGLNRTAGMPAISETNLRRKFKFGIQLDVAKFYLTARSSLWEHSSRHGPIFLE